MDARTCNDLDVRDQASSFAEVFLFIDALGKKLRRALGQVIRGIGLTPSQYILLNLLCCKDQMLYKIGV